MSDPEASTEAIKFALTLPTWETYDFLSMWSEGDFKELRDGWPEAPESVYIGADPLHPETAKLQAATSAQEARVRELEEALRGLMQACEKSFDWQYDPQFSATFSDAQQALSATAREG